MTEREMMRKRAAARKERERKARNRRVVLTVALMLVVCITSIGGTIAYSIVWRRPSRSLLIVN